MALDSYRKHIKRLIRKFAEISYERELREALSKLDADFGEWRENGIDSWKLTGRIHKFHDESARELYKRYTNNPYLDLVVAAAINHDILSKEELPEELLVELSRAILVMDSLDKETEEHRRR